MFLVCLMLYNELVRHYNHKQQVFWDDHYLAAVRGDPADWKFGWRLEDLEQRIMTQRSNLEKGAGVLDVNEGTSLLSRVSHTWHHQRPAQRAETDLIHDPAKRSLASQLLSTQLGDDTAYRTVSCIARTDNSLLRVGPDDFRDVPSDRCQVFSGAGQPGPHAIWEIVDLGNKAVGLRSLSSGKFLKVVAPKSDDWNAPWKVEVVSPLPGLAERFQLAGSKLYSELMHGYLQCSGGGLSEMVKGFPGETLYEESDVYHFNMSTVKPAEMARARTLRAASDHVSSLQRQQLSQFLSLGDAARKVTRGPSGGARLPAAAHRVALCVPITSKGTDMASVDQSPLWFNLFASFMESVDWASSEHEFTFYLGFDKGDSLYDTGDAWGEMREAFAKNTRRALSWLNYDNTTVYQKVLDKKLKLKLMDFSGTAGAPSQVVVGLVQRAFEDGVDYFFQCNDDTVVVSKGWADSFIEALQSNPVQANLGITGPVDTNNDRILTHAFAHRTHIEIFGYFFPPVFKNWWSDDWVSTVYGSAHTFRMYDVLVTHNVQSQKTGALQRYDVDEPAKYKLRVELGKGFVTINRWLLSKHLPRLALPSVCGYSPLMADLYGPLVQKALAL